MTERKEWVRFSHAPSGTTVTVTWQEGNLTARWSVKTYGVKNAIQSSVAEARKGVAMALEELRTAVEAVEDAA